MRPNRIVPFKISGMDSLGQGVSKEGDKITFVPKAIIGDEGEAKVMTEKKGVAFAKINTLTKESDLRISPECIHFKQCPSCHYLHTSYDNEIRFKEQSLERIFRKLPHPKIKVVPALRRLGYRNRVQLHYDLKKKNLGMLDVQSRQIVPIPSCLIALPPILSEIKRLYENENWIKETPKNSPAGHVEIYFREGILKTSWNRPYAEGGFTQVFLEMNELMKSELTKWSRAKNLTTLLDLFAGNGNLSNQLNLTQRLCVDIYSQAQSEEFFSQNLYDKSALANVIQKLKDINLKPTSLLLDPPRSGLKNISEWINELRPQTVAYVACDPQTLVRDISVLSEYSIEELFLFDFFPSTFHFETLVFLERN